MVVLTHDAIHGVVQLRIGVFQYVEIVAKSEEFVIVDAAQSQIAEIVVRIVIALVDDGRDGRGAGLWLFHHLYFHGCPLFHLLLDWWLLLLLLLLLLLHNRLRLGNHLLLLDHLMKVWLLLGLLLLLLHHSARMKLPHTARMSRCLLLDLSRWSLHLDLLMLLRLLLHHHHSHPGIGEVAGKLRRLRSNLNGLAEFSRAGLEHSRPRLLLHLLHVLLLLNLLRRHARSSLHLHRHRLPGCGRIRPSCGWGQWIPELWPLLLLHGELLRIGVDHRRGSVHIRPFFPLDIFRLDEVLLSMLLLLHLLPLEQIAKLLAIAAGRICHRFNFIDWDGHRGNRWLSNGLLDLMWLAARNEIRSSSDGFARRSDSRHLNGSGETSLLLLLLTGHGRLQQLLLLLRMLNDG